MPNRVQQNGGRPPRAPRTRHAALVVRVTWSVVAVALIGGPPAAASAQAPALARGDARPAAAPVAHYDRHNTLTAAERAAGWQLLFDGVTLTGWRGLGRDTVPTAHWSVADGTIRKIASGEVPHAADGQPLVGGDLMTDRTFGDFELVWAWKISPGGNSGVKYNVSEALSTTLEPRYAAKGFEYQILDDDRHEDGKLPSHRAGALYDLVPPNGQKRLRPVGEWNESRLVVRGRHGEHWLNGARVVAYDLDAPAMRAALAASKYRGIRWFADRRRGPIVLQDHGDAVWFRDLKIRPLGGDAP